MRRGRRSQALARIGRPRDDPAGGKVDVQIHQLLGPGALRGGEAEHLVREMQPLVVGPEDLGRDPHPLADQQLVFVKIVRLDREGAMIGGLLVPKTDADRLEQRVGRVVEEHDIISEVKVAVGVDPLRQDLAAVAVERGGDAHTAGRVAARIATG